MKLKLFITLLSGGIAYIIIVLSGLMLHLPLSSILFRGILAFICVGSGSWLITYLMEVLAGNDSKNNSVNEQTVYNDKKNNAAADEGEHRREFSPLNPPVLEVNKDNNQK